MEMTTPLPALDAEGYLVEPQDWSEALAAEFARQEGIEMTDTHWQVIRFIRRSFEEHQIAPDARHVMKYLAEELGERSRNRLFELFPYGYVKQACRIAGMKRPRAWSTG